MNKLKSFFSPNNLISKINGYGFNYSYTKFLITLFGMLAAIVFCCILYVLKLPYILLIISFFAFVLPFIISLQYKYLYEFKRFNDVKNYIENMAYAFKKNPKIVFALEETLFSLNGELSDLIKIALQDIKELKGENVYAEALYKIEEQYNCEKIVDLHRFMIGVEEKGGDYRNFLDTLVMANRRWVERTFIKQKKLAQIKNNSIFCIVASLVIASLALFIRKTGDITPLLAYQVITTAFILVLIIYYWYINKRFNVSWLDEAKSEEIKIRDFNNAFHFDKGFHFKKSFVLSFIIAVFGLVLKVIADSGLLSLVGGFEKILSIFGLIIMGYSVVVFFSPILIHKRAVSQTVREIQFAFSDWLRDVAMGLQFDTIRVSIINSLDNCPVVLREDLELFVEELKEDGVSSKPYHNFLKKYNLVDISSTVASLYSFTNVDIVNVGESVNSLIDRNNTLIDTDEKMSVDNSITFAGMYNYMPLVFAGVKLTVDLLLFVKVMLGKY